MTKLRHLWQAGSNVKNTSIFEASVGGRILLEQTRQLSNVRPAGLDGPQQANAAVAKPLGARACEVARRIRFQGLQVGAGDVAFWAEGAFVVRACAEADGRFYLLVEVLQRLAATRPTSSTWRLEVGQPLRIKHSASDARGVSFACSPNPQRTPAPPTHPFVSSPLVRSRQSCGRSDWATAA